MQFSSALSLLSLQEHKSHQGTLLERPYQKLYTYPFPYRIGRGPSGDDNNDHLPRFCDRLDFALGTVSAVCDGHVDVNITFPVSLSEFVGGCMKRRVMQFVNRFYFSSCLMLLLLPLGCHMDKSTLYWKIASVFLLTFLIPLIPLSPFCDPVQPRQPTLPKTTISLNEDHLTHRRNGVNSVGFLKR